nr:hypothetical protein [Methanobacterium formicicum]
MGIELSSMVKQLENTTRDLSLERSKRLVTEKALKKSQERFGRENRRDT